MSGWLSQSIDYCERADLSLWAEPLNVITNIGFLIATFLVARYYLFKPEYKGKWLWDIHALTFLMMAIGVGSALWHLTAQKWAELADVIPIALFINLFLVSFLVRIAGLKWLAFGGFLAYQGLNYAIGTHFSPSALGGTIMYMPAFISLLLIAVYLWVKGHPMKQDITLATAVWMPSLVLRTMDKAYCEALPMMGTHLWWHLLNAVVLYLVLKALIRHGVR